LKSRNEMYKSYRLEIRSVPFEGHRPFLIQEPTLIADLLGSNKTYFIKI
jgi:hypothetical protein